MNVLNTGKEIVGLLWRLDVTQILLVKMIVLDDSSGSSVNFSMDHGKNEGKALRQC